MPSNPLRGAIAFVVVLGAVALCLSLYHDLIVCAAIATRSQVSGAVSTATAMICPFSSKHFFRSTLPLAMKLMESDPNDLCRILRSHLVTALHSISSHIAALSHQAVEKTMEFIIPISTTLNQTFSETIMPTTATITTDFRADFDTYTAHLFDFASRMLAQYTQVVIPVALTVYMAIGLAVCFAIIRISNIIETRAADMETADLLALLAVVGLIGILGMISWR